jgi:hypothetical protein
VNIYLPTSLAPFAHPVQNQWVGGRMARETGLEPAASAVTGRRSNQLSYSRGRRNQLDPRRIEGIKASLRLVKAVAIACTGSPFLPQQGPGFSAEISIVSLVPNQIMPASPLVS